ncbi:hypothetical protein HYH02_007805 [Chlamydomonas schloesseri]|uniref:Uncharacterized protein n=1 Tax=Chlamydomonas schloesseri TaxID=2026947 RepID=A0A836B4I3_9CHLO|nr:hypothetical protein HYH02_007805 [Chlamydomonas schloesseri]|eukprot:KAG2447054.1 hypothetical protein HYH02_007805 [Chlamydomonas schloesseri]
MPPSWFAACFGHANDATGGATSSAGTRRAAISAGYQDDGIMPAKSDSKRSFNILGVGKGSAKGGEAAAWADDRDGVGDGESGPGLTCSTKLRINSATSGPCGPLPDSPSAKLRKSKKHLRAHLKQAQPKRSILKRNGTGSMAGGADGDLDGLGAAGEVPPWDDFLASAPCSPAGGGAGGGCGFGDGPAYGCNNSSTAMNAWEPSPSRFNGSVSRIVPLPATAAATAAAAMAAAAGVQQGADRRGSGGSWAGGGERPLSPGGGRQLYGSGCDGGACVVLSSGADEGGPRSAPWLRGGGGGGGYVDADAAGGAGSGSGLAGGLPTPSRLAHSSTAGVMGLDGVGHSSYSGYSSCSGAAAGGGGSRPSSTRGGLRGAGVPAVVMPSSGGGGLSGGLSVASAASRAALAHGSGGSRSSQASHVNEGAPGGQGATASAFSSLGAGASPIGGGGAMSAPVVWSTNQLCDEPADCEEQQQRQRQQRQWQLHLAASCHSPGTAAGEGLYGGSLHASFDARAPPQQRSLRAERPAALILPIERTGSGSGRSPAAGAGAGAGAGGGGGASSGGHRSLRIPSEAAAAAGLASRGQDTPQSTPAGASAAAFSRRNTYTSTSTSTHPVPSPAAVAALEGSSRAALAGASRDEVMRVLAAESPGRSPMWYDHKARELMQLAAGAARDEGPRGGGAWQQQPQQPNAPGVGDGARVQPPQSISALRQLATTTGCDAAAAAAAAAVRADAVALSAPATALDGYSAASSSVGAAAAGAHVFSLSSRSALKGGGGGGGAGAGTHGNGDGAQAGVGYALTDTGDARRPSAAGPPDGNRSLRSRGSGSGGYASSAPATHTGLVALGGSGRLPGSITGDDDDDDDDEGGLADVLGRRAADATGATAAAVLLASPQQLLQQQQQQQAAAAAAYGLDNHLPSRNSSLLQRYASGTGLSERPDRVVGGPGSASAAFRARAATVSGGGGDRQAAVLHGPDGAPPSPGAAQRPGGAAVAYSSASAAAAAAASHSHSPHAFRAGASAAPKARDVGDPTAREPPHCGTVGVGGGAGASAAAQGGPGS